MNNFAYATLITKNEFYYGAIGLKRSLDLVQTRYPLVIFYTDNIQQRAITLLTQAGCDCIEIDPPRFLDPRMRMDLLSKWEIYNNTKYDRYCFLDDDIIVCKNLDHLFEIDKEHIFLGHMLDDDLEDFGTSLWKSPTDNIQHHMRLSNAIMLGSPNQQLYNDLLEMWYDLSTNIEVKKDKFTFSEEYIQNFYFNKYWDKYKDQIYLLDERLYNYNAMMDLLNLSTINDAYILHYMGKFKPWKFILSPLYQQYEQFIKDNEKYLNKYQFFNQELNFFQDNYRKD